MASRHLRKLQELRQEEDPSDSESESESEDDIGFASSSAQTSAFALLSNDGEDEDEEEEVEVVLSSEPEVEVPAAAEVPKKGKKKKKKKKKKDKVKGSNEEDLDALLEEFGVVGGDGSGGAQAGTTNITEADGLLSVDPKFLSPERELRRIFGSGAVAPGGGAGGRERAGHRGQHQHNHHHGGGGRQPRRLAGRRHVLFQPPANWGRRDFSLISMDHVGTGKDGSSHFEFRWSEEYRQIQRNYETVASTHDPNQIVLFVNRLSRANQFCIDALMALFYVSTHTGDFASADTLLHQCVFFLEGCFNQHFDVTGGRCRLSHKREENRALHEVLFRYVASLSRRGCHRSALEVSKVLLSLDMDDPMGVLFMVDYHSIRAREYGFLIRLAQRYEDSVLPNLAFSSGLAKWYHERDGGDPAELGEDVSDLTSSELLRQAIQTHPYAARRLVERLCEKGMARSQEWDGLLQRPPFKGASAGGSASLEHLVSLFVERSYELWKDSEIQKCLKSAASACADSPEDEDLRALRMEIFPASEVNEYRHISIPDFSDQLNHIPEEVLAQLAPQQQQQVVGHHVNLPQGLGQTTVIREDELRESSAMQVLLQSLLPWVSVEAPAGNNPPDPPADDL